ncbi:membrane protein FxsA [Ensifer sp. HO-A22]|uniref:Membrane protein FxsA n=1 Tax=Ensifer oleiphilus TaxID=2742698 RepID=A0A7Y6Q7W3_9HYPH|nr:FxsA family protein [Ensifer oleiphilus]NVD40708.1 membrane protein FxsA [Ensifer oleiphilus]
MRSIFIPLVILGLPLAEIAGFVIVGREIGLAMTLLLVLLSAIAGVILLRFQGFAVIRRVQEATRTGSDPGREVISGALMFVAALLLMVPGFISDIFGLLLFVPPVRQAIAGYLRSRMTVVTAASSQSWRGPSHAPQERSQPRVIDLGEGEFSRADDDETNPSEERRQQ